MIAGLIKQCFFDPEQLMITAKMIYKIHEAVQSLPARCKLIFKLVKEEGLQYREVAELLNLSVKTIENQMTLALKKLGQLPDSIYTGPFPPAENHFKTQFSIYLYMP